ncbi:MAG: YraN family protein [Deltaproteobacteria bacterium]|nr:YraN family protein [Deltaproteobacteria bacterium]
MDIDPRQELGRWAEDLAAAHLESAGYRILDRNVHYPVGELDIVAEHGEDLVFVEVRARSHPEEVHPAETVTARKQRRIVLAAMTYCQDHAIGDRMIRFDVVAVLSRDGELEVYQNAFEAGR